MTRVDHLAGNLLAATWLDSGLFAIQIIQGITYFSSFNDSLFLKGLVSLLFVVDVVGLLGEYVTVYLDLVVHYGENSYLQSPDKAPRAIYLLSIMITAFLVQLYLTTRIQRLSNNWYLTVFLAVGSLAGLAGGLGLVVINTIFSSLKDRSKQNVVTPLWLASSAGVDVLIAMSLVYYFRKAKKASSFKNTRSVLSRLISSAVESGSITAALAVLVLVTFNTLQGTNWAVSAVFILGRAYSVTLLYNLNARTALKTQMHTGSTEVGVTLSLPTSRTAGAGTQTGNQIGGEGNRFGSGIEIQVAKSAVMKSDSAFEPIKSGWAM